MASAFVTKTWFNRKSSCGSLCSRCLLSTMEISRLKNSIVCSIRLEFRSNKLPINSEFSVNLNGNKKFRCGHFSNSPTIGGGSGIVDGFSISAPMRIRMFASRIYDAKMWLLSTRIERTIEPHRHTPNQTSSQSSKSNFLTRRKYCILRLLPRFECIYYND